MTARAVVLEAFSTLDAQGSVITLTEIAQMTGKSIMMVRHILLKDGLWTAERRAEANRLRLSRSNAHLSPQFGLRNKQACFARKRRILQEAIATTKPELVWTTFTEREKQLLTYRFGEERTMAETGKLLGITRERVRQLEDKALLRLQVIHRLTA